MPLNRPALTLGSGPSGVHEARRWVRDTCVDIGRPDLVACAEMAVSEVVTNALLHGENPIRVRVRGTHDHPRVEVADASREAPLPPGTDHLPDEQGLLLTFGRGLGIVSRCSSAWGAEIEDDGKVVWFVPAPDADETSAVEGVITGLPHAGEEPDPAIERVTIDIRGVPVRSLLDFQVHYRELRREVRLLALTHEADYPLAKTLSDLFGSLDRVLRDGVSPDQVDDVLRAGHTSADLVVETPRSVVSIIGRFLEVLDLADAFCHDERLLSLARSPEQREFQQWFLGEFVRQQRGEQPTPWTVAPFQGDRIVS